MTNIHRLFSNVGACGYVVIIVSNLIMWGPVLLAAFDAGKGFFAVGDFGVAR